MPRWQTCNVLRVGSQNKQLWQFGASSEKFPLQRDETKLPAEPFSPKLVEKDWQTLVQPKLNVAWLPVEQVFLRVVQLPKADEAETRSMVELQLEKLSPLPVAQIVWSYQLIPQPFGEMQTAIVLIASRSAVEEFLGQLEGQGYLADRLELPLLDQLAATKVEGYGVWLYPGVSESGSHCLVAWWYGEVLWHLSLVLLPPGEERGKLLREQLTQMAWAGELEGWLNAPPRYHVVADLETAEPWVKEFVGEHNAIVVAPLPSKDLATLTGRRVARNSASTNLLPSEYVARYRQLFYDKLWMQGLGGVLAVYLFGIMIYFLWVQVEKFRLDTLQDQAGARAVAYTNTLQLKEQVRVLRDQLALQYAALDCWRSMAESLPMDLQLDSMNFDRGLKVTFFGSCDQGARAQILDFNAALIKTTARAQPLFSRVYPPNITSRPGTSMLNWNFACESTRKEGE